MERNTSTPGHAMKRMLATVVAVLLFAALSLAFMDESALAQAAGASSIEGSLNVWEKQLVQEGLILLGYYNGFADGQFGGRTRDAISKFQTDRHRDATGEVGPADALELGGQALDLQEKIGWQALANPKSGITLSYPSGFLTKRQDNDSGGETLTSADARVKLTTLRFPNAGAGGIDKLFQTLSHEDGSKITYQFRKGSLFILSGINGQTKFYSRFEQQDDEVRGYDLSWQADKDGEIFDNISILISNSFYPFGGNPNQGQPSYPTLIALAKQNGGADASGGDASSGANGSDDSQTASNGGGGNASNGAGGNGGSDTSATTKNADGTSTPDMTVLSNDKDGVVEVRSDALSPEKGQLTTSDGRGMRFIYHYLPPDNPAYKYAYQWAVDTHLFASIPELDAMDGLFVLPHYLHYVTRECGQVNAFYNKDDSSVSLCYEMIDSLLKMGQGLSKGSPDAKALSAEFVRDNVRFILLHESGHAMIDLLDLPAVGREEDSVDQLATVLLLMNVTGGDESTNDIARVLQLAATWFKVGAASSDSPDMAVFADEHSLDAQRYFNLLCITYGLDPDGFQGIVNQGMLPKARADRCPDEASKIQRSWARLIVPHFAPRYQPKDDGTPANSNSNGADNAAPAPAQQDENPLEWDRKSNPFGK
jgi:peptidoglycan hydrolase-like protein with peptidoglycan-binding domain